MAYEKQTWVDDETPVDAEHLNHIEDGIGALAGISCGTCSTGVSAAAKVVDADLNELTEGAAVYVTFSNASTAGAPTLNVNDLGAKNIYVNGSTASSTNYFRWCADAKILFVYDGSYWVPIGATDTYAGASTSSASTSTKTTTIANFVLKFGTTVTVNFTNANTVETPMLNVSSTGAISIYGNCQWSAGDSVTFVLTSYGWTVEEDCAAIQGITVNGTAAEVVNHIAQISVSGGWEIGYAESGQRLAVRGNCVFGLFNFGNEGLGAFAFDSLTEMSTGPINMEYSSDEATVIPNEAGFYVIFGADSIVID